MGDGRPAASMQAAAASAEFAVPEVTAAPPAAAALAAPPLKIVHVLRAPVGGLFRHVLDLARGQAARGHRVGVIADSLTGGARADAALAEIAPQLALGVQRVAIARQLGAADLGAARAIARRIALAAPDVVHGHGAKGGALARLTPGAPNAIGAYTPHGGSLGYRPGTLAGGFYRTLEWLLKWRSDLFLFESHYAAATFRARMGRPPGLVRVVHNGVGEDEFAPIANASDATDIVALGELRLIKGFDVLITALAMLKASGRQVTATIAGEGPREADFKRQAERLQVADLISFVGHRTAREAFAMGRTLIVSSRSESLPYVVLEAAAAGMPIIATRVGGIPEIFGAEAAHLVVPNDAGALAEAIRGALDAPAQARRVAAIVTARVRREFSLTAMVDGALAAYREAIAMRKLAQFA
jgi:glycosyltransferase involved in cell wall biosynthesis